MNKNLLIVGGALGLGLISYGIHHFAGQYKLLKKTCFNFVGYEIIALNKNHIKIAVSLKIKNQSNITLDLYGYTFDVYINNYFVSKVKSNERATINKNDFTELKVIIDIDPSAIGNPNFLSGLLLNYQAATVRIKGNVSVHTGGLLAQDLPINAESKLRDMITTGAPQPCI